MQNKSIRSLFKRLYLHGVLQGGKLYEVTEAFGMQVEEIKKHIRLAINKMISVKVL